MQHPRAARVARPLAGAEATLQPWDAAAHPIRVAPAVPVVHSPPSIVHNPLPSSPSPDPADMRPIFRVSAAAVAALALLAAPLHGQSADSAATPPVRWSDGPALAAPRDHHAVFAVAGRGTSWLYVAGGTDYRQFFDGVVRAPIRPDGALGPWEDAGRLPAALGGSSIAVAGGFAVLTGGQVAADGNMRALRRVADVAVAPIGADGRLGAWRAGPALPVARFHHPAVHHGGMVYVVGGQGERVSEAGVFGARMGADGTLGAWTALTPLPRPRSHHAALVHDGHLYVVGGLDGDPAGHLAVYTDVLRAPIQADGTLGEWRIASRMPHSYATHAAFVHGGALWVLGGVEDNQRFVNHVWRAAFGANGALGRWEEVDPGLPLARGHVHETPVVGGRVYSVGGRIIPAAQGASTVTGAAHVGELRP